MIGSDQKSSQPLTTGPSGVIQPRPARPGYTPTEADRTLITRVTDRVAWNNRDAGRWAFERQMFESIAFADGSQWIQYDESSRRFSKWNAPSWFPTPMTNHFQSRVGIMETAILRAKPEGRVRPNTNDPKDREAAKVAEHITEHIYDVAYEEELRHLAAKMVTLTGTVIAEDYWDPTAGKILRIPRGQMVDSPAMEPAAVCPTCGPESSPQDAQYTGMPCPTCQSPMEPGERPKMLSDGTPAINTEFQPEMDEQQQPIVDEVAEGEVCSRVRMLFNFYWDPKATCLREARWCGEALFADLDWIDEHYPEMGPYVGEESGIDTNSFYETALLALIGPSQQNTPYVGGSQRLTNGAILRKYQEKPSQQYPRGKFVVVANGVKLYEGDLPIQDENGRPTGDFNYTEFRYDVVPGRLAGRTPSFDMVPLQRRINAIDAHVVLNRKTLLSPWIIAPKGSGLNPGQVAMRPGAVILYNSIGVANSPQVVQGTALPAQVYQERQTAVEAMDEMARDASAVANAQIPAGMKSGISMHFLKELQDEQSLPRLQRYGQWISERDRKKLLIAQQKYVEPRAVKLVGDGSDYQVRYWKGADLQGNVDISVLPGSLVPRSKSMQTQTVMDAIQMGLIDITDPLQKQRALDELGLTAFDTEIGPDRRRAQKENAQMDDGELVQITENEDSQVHFAEHVARQKDPSFESLPDLAKQAHSQHLQATQQAIQQQTDDNLKTEAQKFRMQQNIEAEAKAAAKGLISPQLPPVDMTNGEQPEPLPGDEQGTDQGTDQGPIQGTDQGQGLEPPPDAGQAMPGNGSATVQ